MSSKGATTITYEQLMKMKMRANLVPSSDHEENKANYLHMQSQKRTDNWKDNPKDLKKRKQEERFRKFEKEQLERRKIDEQEKKFQSQKKAEQLKKANEKLFQDSQKVRALNSKLLYSDALQGRQEQIEIKKYIQDIDKKRQQYFHEQTLNQVKKTEQEQRRKRQEEKNKLKQFEKNLRKQHKQVKRKYINQIKQEMEEGQLLRMRAEAAIREQQEKQRERRSRTVQNRLQANSINEKNKQLKEIQRQKELQEQKRIEEFRRKQVQKDDETKRRNQQLINDVIKQREQLCKQQAFKLSQVKNTEVERLNNQINQLEKKQAEIERKKEEQKKVLKHQYEESLKEQVEKKRLQKQRQQQEREKFKNTWNSKLGNLKGKEDEEQNFRKYLNKKNADELKRQMQEKQIKRQIHFRKEIEEAEHAKANIENEEKQFKSYAEKCTKQWASNGKNLYPIIKHLTATMKQTNQLI